jgi:hypothetical protein
VPGPAWQDAALWVAVLMAAFAMLFGTRRASATEHNRGLVLAIGFASVIKLGAMIALGLFAVWGVGGGWAALSAHSATLPPRSVDGTYFTLIGLGALAMFTVPHQFHAGTVELRDVRHLATARWLFRSTSSRSACRCCRSRWPGIACSDPRYRPTCTCCCCRSTPATATWRCSRSWAGSAPRPAW